MSEAHKILMPRYHLLDSDSSLFLNDDEVLDDIVMIQRQSKRQSMCHHLFSAGGTVCVERSSETASSPLSRYHIRFLYRVSSPAISHTKEIMVYTVYVHTSI